jgi:hypothetical protein
MVAITATIDLTYDVTRKKLSNSAVMTRPSSSSFAMPMPLTTEIGFTLLNNAVPAYPFFAIDELKYLEQ